MANEFPHEPQVKPIHFFKIITDQSLHEGKLMIPRNFVEKYGKGLPNTILLKPPNGDEWKLNLVKRDGKIWFHKGWKEFAEYHSLAYGHLLVFGYKGTSHFHVHIFDQSALEIKYPFNRVEANKRASNNGQGINKPPNDENPKDHRAGQKRKANSSFEFLHPCEMESSRRFKVGNTFKLKKAALHNSDRKCKANSSLEFLQPCEKGSRCVEVGNTLKLQKVALHHTNRKCKGKQIITAKKVAALDRASSFKTCNPSFLVVMHRSYVVEARCMNLPYGFGKRHLDLGKKGGDIQLRVLNGEVWPARYCIWKDNTRTKFELSGGWKAFVKDNNLKVGDVCTFELIPGTKLTFQVHIFRETDNSTCLTSQESAQRRVAIKERERG